MTLQFPSAPVVGDLFPDPALPGVGQFQWDGSKWTTAVQVVTPLSTVQRFTSGSGTYVPPPGVSWINVRILAGGGGGGGAGAGVNGGASSFGGWTCIGGGAGGAVVAQSGASFGAGGTGGVNGSGSLVVRTAGGNGESGVGNSVTTAAVNSQVNGGPGFFGGSGSPGGGGYGGRGVAAAVGSGGGGGAGEYAECIILNPSPTAWSIGGGGAGGGSNANVQVGGPGASGIIIVTEHYGRIPTPQAVVQLPTYQTFTSGSGTYSPPNGLTFIRVRMCGGGGGGSGGRVNTTTNPATAASGTATSFGGWVCNGGAGGAVQVPVALGGSGGANGVGTLINRIKGGDGGGAIAAAVATGVTVYPNGGAGGGNGGGGGGFGSNNPSVGNNGSPNSGGGGGGGGGSASTAGSSGVGGFGGGAGEIVEFTVSSPSAVPYVVGAGGAGSAGSGLASNGGNGAAGIIIVEEHYNRASLDSLPTSGNGGALLTQNQPVIMGVTNGSNAGPGEVGEFLTVSQSGSASIAAATWVGLTSLVVPPGDWDLVCRATVSASTVGDFTSGMAFTVASGAVASTRSGNVLVAQGFSYLRLSASVSTTVFVAAYGTVAASAQNGAIWARRAR